MEDRYIPQPPEDAWNSRIYIYIFIFNKSIYTNNQIEHYNTNYVNVVSMSIYLSFCDNQSDDLNSY